MTEGWGAHCTIALRAARPWVAVWVLCLAGAGALRAEPLPREQVPEPLRPWIDWVLRDVPEAACPFAQGNPDERLCLWPGALALDAGPQQAQFEQTWQVFQPGWVRLPGSRELWPEDVYADGRPVAVVGPEGPPRVRLERGRHTLRGRLRWTRMPQTLAIAENTGLVELRVDGKRVPFPRRSPADQLWLGAAPAAESGESRLEVSVQRRLIDEAPLELETRIELRVSGPSREQDFGGILPAGFLAASLDSPLPARIDAQGALRAQLQPGSHVLRVFARHTQRPPELALPQPRGPWASEETWVFEARPQLRIADVQGVPAVDPQQTELPPEWRALPAYQLEPGSRLQLIERQRGDADPSPDQLGLERLLWLDFDGGGYTAQDRISGALSRSWRLESAPETRLGRASVAGEGQTITVLGADTGGGIELRAGALELVADLRMERGSSLPASGWRHDFDRVSTELRLPPGWQLLHAGGVDRVRGSWLVRWTLADLFLVLVGALAIGQLFGPALGAAALAAFALTFTEPGAPRYAWLLALAAVALQRAVSGGRFETAAGWLRGAAVLLLAAGVLPFAAAQTRLALHPALERGGWQDPVRRLGFFEDTEQEVRGQYPAQAPEYTASTTAPASPEEVASLAEPQLRADGEMDAYNQDSRQIGKVRKAEGAARTADKPPLVLGGDNLVASSTSALLLRPDPQALVATGPGVPAWRWRQVRLEWPGPVRADERMTLWLLPPWLGSAIGALRVGLLAALFVLLAREGLRFPPLRARAAAALLAALTAAALASPARAQFPTTEQLDQLRERLVELPSCAPRCAASSRLRLEASETALALRVHIDAAWPTAVPLPGSLMSWTPTRVAVNSGTVPPVLSRTPDGTLLLALPAGSHDVLLDGPLPAEESIDLPLQLAPFRVESSARGWTVSGARDGQPTDSLRLLRVAGAGSLQPLGPSAVLPGFAQIRRTLTLGLTWTVLTQVTRLTPAGSPLQLEVPLLPGESVTTRGVAVAGGRAQVNLAADAAGTFWESVLAPAESIELRAPASPTWREEWALVASPLWHVETEGIPTTLAGPADARLRVREWRPWPDERVALRIARPAGAPGESLTLDRSALRASPGLRSTDWSLDVELRASRGQNHRVALPPGAELMSALLDGTALPLRLERGGLELPLHPGTQRAAIRWRQPGGAGTVFGTPVLDVGAPSVNASLEFAVPADRWVLWTSGPRLGPAVLFWSSLAVIALLAFGLGRLRWVPLGTGSWFLLLLGLTQIPWVWGGVFAGWLLALGARSRGAPARPLAFNAVQVALVVWTLAALYILLIAIQEGLLGQPQMQIAGNGSSGAALRWYQDRVPAALPSARVLWVPLWVYKLAMLSWALWIAGSLLRWLRWGWAGFNQGGAWRRRARVPASAA